jgi:hypothetical protein
MPRTATVGPEILKRITELTKDGKTGRTEAFAKVAQERNMQAGTVAANYLSRGPCSGSGRESQEARYWRQCG